MDYGEDSTDDVKETVKEAVVEKPQETVQETVKSEGDDSVPAWAQQLRDTVEELRAQVAALAPITEQDSQPTGRPWTAWGGR